MIEDIRRFKKSFHPRAKFSSLEMYFIHLSFERHAQGLFVLGEKLLLILADWVLLPMHLQHMTNPELAVKLCSRDASGSVWIAGVHTCTGIPKLLISAKGIASLRSDPLGPSNCTEQRESLV